MIDLVYQTVLTVLSKDNQGYVTPEEFNKISNLVQMEIFRGYFEDENRDKNKQNRGLSNEGYSNLPFHQRQRIDQFAATASLVYSAGTHILPADLYVIEEDGISLPTNGAVIEEVERKDLAFLNKSDAKPTVTYPVYERFNTYIKVYPTSVIVNIDCRYLRTPKAPKWTYYVMALPDGSQPVMFDSTNPSFQDFELHESEFSNIVIKVLSYFGITLRESDVVQITESLKQQVKIENQE